MERRSACSMERRCGFAARTSWASRWSNGSRQSSSSGTSPILGPARAAITKITSSMDTACRFDAQMWSATLAALIQEFSETVYASRFIISNDQGKVSNAYACEHLQASDSSHVDCLSDRSLDFLRSLRFDSPAWRLWGRVVDRGAFQHDRGSYRRSLCGGTRIY